MSSVEVGMTAPIKGRLPHNWRIVAHFAAGMLKITSPDTDNFLIVVETNKMHEYSAEYEKTSAKLDQDSYVDAKYDDESGVLRFDSETHPEFWIEVNVNRLLEQDHGRVGVEESWRLVRKESDEEAEC